MKHSKIQAPAGNRLAQALKRNRDTLLLCLIAALLWGLLAHSYMFLHSSFSHDSLNEFNAEVFGNDWKIQLGRVFVPYYRVLVRGSITLPWLIGILSLTFIGLAVFLTVKLFRVRSRALTVLIAGVFTVNITVIATAATYINDLDSNMLALALAVLSAYLWNRSDKGFVYGMIPLCLSIGLYQSFLSVAITMILMVSILRLLDGDAFGSVFKNGLKGILMILGAGALYFLSMKAICHLTGNALQTGHYNSMDTVLSKSLPELIRTTIKGCKRALYKILTATSAYPKPILLAVHGAMIALAGAIVLGRLFQRAVKVKEKILALVLIALLPIGMNVVYPLTGGISHDVMEYGYWLAYLFALLIAWWAGERFEGLKRPLKSAQRIASACLVAVVLWGNVQTANAAYLKKDLEQKANLSLFTRVVDRMELCDGYVTGETPVVFAGKPKALLDSLDGFEHVQALIGSGGEYVLGAAKRDYCQAYFDDVLMNPAVMADEETWLGMQENARVAAMPCYPAADSVAMVDGVLVVKLGE